MKHTDKAAQNALLCFLGLTPVYSLICRAIMVEQLGGALLFALICLVCGILALLPGYVGSYSETAQVRQVGGYNHGSDPNPDKEYEKEIIKTGHRFPLRLVAYLVVFCLTFIGLVFLPTKWFIAGKMGNKLIYMGLFLICSGIAMYTIPSSMSMWDTPGGIIGSFVAYLAAAVYLHFAKVSSAFNTYICVCALLFLLLGCLSLNRAAIGAAGGKDMVSRRMKRKNRVLVISLITIIAAVAFIEPVRDGAVWLVKTFWAGVRWFFGLFRGTPSEEAPETMDMLMQTGVPMQDAGFEEEAVSSGPSLLDNIVMYGFFSIVAAGFIWLVFDKLIALVRKLSRLFESFAASVGEGYYDEKEDLSDEGGTKLKSSFRERVKQLFTRETPWDKLSGREKARRLVKELYKKRGKKISSLRTLTAREAISQMNIKKGSAEDASSAYDKARYSSREVDSASMDGLRKEIKP